MDFDLYDYSIKEELDSDTETDTQTSSKRDPKKIWCTASTLKLIEALKNDCKELWDSKHPLNKDRVARAVKHDYLAQQFETTPEEISRKIHNLRTQFNNELRKIKKRVVTKGSGEEGAGVAMRGGWEYFESLSFLLPAPSADPLDTAEGVNVALAEFQANEELEFAAAAAARKKKNSRIESSPCGDSEGRAGRRGMSTPRMGARAPPPQLPVNSLPMMWPEEASPRIRPIDSIMQANSSISTDECQIFGDFVASELRSLRSDESRKKLKRIIQKAILQVAEQEDEHLFSGARANML